MQNVNNFVPTFDGNSAYRAALQGIPALNQPVYNPQQLQAQQSTPQLTPEQLEYIRNYNPPVPVNPQEEKLKNSFGLWAPQINLEGHPELSRALNIPSNFLWNDPLRIGTGFVGEVGRLIDKPAETLGEYKNSIRDYLIDLGYRSEADADTLRKAGVGSIFDRPAMYGKNVGQDIWNAFQGTLPALNTKRVGEIVEDLAKGDVSKAKTDVKQVGYDTWRQIADHPLITGLMVAPNPTVKALGKTASGALNLAEKAGVPVGEVSRNVAKAVQAVESKFNRDAIKLGETANDLAKASERDLAIVRDYMDGVAPLPEDLKPLYEKFKKFNEEYRNTNIDDNALVNPQELTALQYVQRQTGRTIQDIRREVTPQLEALQEGITDQSLLFKNRLADFEHEVGKFRKESKNKDYLKDTKPISELTRNEFDTLSKYLTEDELRAAYEQGLSIKEIKNSIGKNVRSSWYPEVKNMDKFKNAIYQENMAKLASLAESTGNSTLKHLYDGLRLGEEGRGVYTMAGANIPEKGLVDNAGRRFQGASSSREYGTASSEEVAKAYKNVHQFLDDVAAQRAREEIGRNIVANGTIDGYHKLVGEGVAAEDIRYINPEVLTNGTYTEAISRASKNPFEGAIPIDKYNLKALQTLTAPNGGFQGVWKDILNLYKEAALASGIYLGGNLASGVYGTILSSGSPAGLVKDIAAAIGSKGQLAKELGTFRRIRPRERSYSTKLGKGLSWLGGWMGSRIAPRIDAFINNSFSEINAHSQLRKMGINQADRLNTLANMEKIKLGEFIENNRLNSMLNNKFRIIPRGTARDVMSVANPFIDWVDTSTQVSAKLLRDHPVLMGAVTAKLFGTIGFDRELQNRLGLKVYSDKPMVTYKADAKAPNGVKEVSLSFVPQLTPLEFMANPSKLVIGSSGMPVLTAIYEASKGNTAYGNPMRRTAAKDSIMTIMDNDRYIVNPETGALEQINKTQGDEVLSTAIKNLMAPPNMWNKTIAPIGVETLNRLTGSDLKWYMPYGQSIFGSTKTGQPELGSFSRNIISTGNPDKERSVEDIIKGLGTVYERDYYPEGQMTGNLVRRVKRAGVRQNRRIFGEQ